MVLGGLALATPASAKTTQAKVVSYGKISCYATIPAAGRGIICSSPTLPDTGELDPYVGLNPHGKSILSERGDYAGFSNVKRVKLALHDRWVWHGIRCTAGKDGMSCLNRDDKGFHIGPAGYQPLS